LRHTPSKAGPQEELQFFSSLQFILGWFAGLIKITH